MAELSKAERALAKDVKAFSDEYLKWQRELQPDVFPAISQGMDLIVVGLDKIGPGVSGAGGSANCDMHHHLDRPGGERRG
ncbi:hypothetical protein ACFV1N_48575 [Streptosporangium canum]|uniref:hypothetical protein n=1 Tax=Streptosporangium canum TaxID=324952 RepID=UPI0036A9847A